MFKKQNIFNRIILTLIMVLTINFLTPNYSHAGIGSALADGFQTLVCLVGDGVITIEQKLFIGTKPKFTYKDGQKTKIQYGVANIVSGTLSFFDINFFNPKETMISYEEEYNSAALRNMYDDVLEELQSDFGTLNSLLENGQIEYIQPTQPLSEYSGGNYGGKELCLEEVIYSSRETDFGDEAEADGYTRSFGKLLDGSYTYNGKGIEEFWKECYPNEEPYYESDFYYTFINYSNDGTNANWRNMWTQDTGLIKSDGSIDIDKCVEIFKKIEPVIEKCYNDSLTEVEVKSTASVLAPIIRKWYGALRNIALVLLLSILVYIGIKIILSSTANDKANYKQKIINFVVAVCLLFIMQYIMSFTIYIIDVINESLGVNVIDQSGNDILLTNIRASAEISKSGPTILVYTFIYLVMVWYTLIFTVMYIRRMLTIILLTIFAPMVTITYPIDKEKDGKSQAFDYWLKEYVFNILIQPMHLLLYYIFISSTITLVENGNFIWAIVALWFIRRAEKLMRKMFKLDNSDTLSDFGSFASGAALASVLKKLANKATHGKGKSKSNNKDNNNDKENNKIRTPDIEETFEDEQPQEKDKIRTKDEGDNKKENDTENTKKKGEQDKKIKNQSKSREESKNKKKQKAEKKQEKKSVRQARLRGVKRVGKKVFKGKNIAKVARGIGKVYLGGAGLGIGMAAGIVSGDLGKVFTYGAAGTALGTSSVDAMSRGVSAIGNAGKAIKNTAIGVSDTYKIGANNYTQDEYEDKILIPRMKRAAEKDKNIQDMYERELGSKELMKSSGRDALYDARVTDEKLIIRALKVQQEQGISNREMVQNTVIASKIKDTKDLEAREKQLREILQNRGVSDKALDKQVKDRMRIISKISGVS